MDESIHKQLLALMVERQRVILAFNAVIRRYPMHAQALRRAKRAAIKEIK